MGNLSPALTKNSLLRLAQHQAYNNGIRRHAIAQRFVVGKLRNMRTILMRYHRLYPDPMIGTQIESLKHCISASEQTTLNTSDSAIDSHEIDSFPLIETNEVVNDRMHGMGSLIGCEGAGSAAYFSVFGRL